MTVKSRAIQRRFTVLELVISVALLAVVTALAVTAGTAITNSWARLDSRERQFAELMVLDRTFDTMFTGVLPFRWNDRERNEMPFFRGIEATLRFAYQHPFHDQEQGAFRFVLLELVDGEVRAVYAPRPFMDEEDLRRSGRVSVLANGVEALRFRYAVFPEGSTPDDPPVWRDDWLPEELDARERTQHTRPLAIWATVEWADGRVEHWLRRTPGNSRYERRGVWRPFPE